MSEGMTGRMRCAATRHALAAKIQRPAAARAWAQMHDTARQLLVGLCCAGRSERDAAMPWASFTDAERDAMGAAARQLARDLIAAAYLR